jgi:LuxR family transcriptional regulator, maltose regulon positive regulatory protein
MVDAGLAGEERRSSSGLPQIALTKTVPPAANRLRIERGRLLDLLQDAADRRLIVLKAPAGYGKTTLAVDWSEQLRRSRAVVAWLSVDEDDNEPSAFAYHITRTLHRAAPELGQSAIDLLAETKLIAPKNVMSAAINALAESDDEVYLFLDDYHAIADSRPHELTGFLLRYAPSNFHLVVMSRTEPPLPVSRMQLADDVIELDAASLRFTADETRQFLSAELAPKLDAADISKLHEATEGWPAALQLARITVRNSVDPAATVRSFSGASRKISAYIEDTLATQADEIVQFLLQTAILDRLHGSLCQAVTGIAHSGELLKALDHEQLLLVTLDEQGGWYRYHHLMIDFLLDRLHTRMADEIPELHRRAYRWYADHQMWNDAVQHAIAARDFDQALAYVEQCAMSLVVTGDLLTLLSWERKLPVELMSGQVEVKLALAWSLILVTRFAEGEALLAQVEQAADEVRTPELFWRCRAARGVLAAMSDDSNSALALGTQCQGKMSFDPFYRNALCNVMRFGQWKAGNFETFYALPKPDISDGESTYVLAEQYRLCLYGMVAAQQLRIDEALECYREARSLIERYAGSKSAAAAIPTGLSAELRYETGDINGAEISVLDELDLIETTVFHESFLSGHLVLVRAAMLRGDVERTLMLLNRGERLARERGWNRTVAALLVERVRLLLRERRIQDAMAVADQLQKIQNSHPVPARCSWSDIHIGSAIVEGLVALASGRTDVAVRLLTWAYDELLGTDNRRGALRTGLELANALLIAGNRTQAFDVLKQVLGWAAGANAVAFLLERPDDFTQLLSAAHRDLGSDPSLREFLNRVATDMRAEGGSNSHVRASKQVLTERERSIVEFIAGGQSNKQIARTLGVTPPRRSRRT